MKKRIWLTTDSEDISSMSVSVSKYESFKDGNICDQVSMDVTLFDGCDVFSHYMYGANVAEHRKNLGTINKMIDLLEDAAKEYIKLSTPKGTSSAKKEKK